MKLVVKSGEREEQVEVRRRGDAYAVTLGESTYEIDAADLGHGMRSLRVLGETTTEAVPDGSGRLHPGDQHEVAVHPAPAPRDAENGRYRVSRSATEPAVEVEVLDPLTHLARKSRGGAGAAAREQVTALMPGRVVAILAKEGDPVEAGQGVVVLEAMKMENEIPAEGPGVIKKLFVQEGQTVEGGEPLFSVGPAEG